MQPDKDETTEELAQRIKEENGYVAARVLPDGSIAVLWDLAYTRAIVLGVDEFSWKKRFCFDDRGLAVARFIELKSEEDEPQGYIAKRPQGD